MPTWALKSDFLGLKFRPTTYVAVDPQLTLLGLMFIVCKMGIITEPIL